MPKQQVAIIGGGIAGISAALELSPYNLDIHVIEKSCFLGGQALNYNCKATEECQQCGACLVEKKLKELQERENISFHLGTSDLKCQKDTYYQLKFKKDPLFESSQEQEVLKSIYNQDNSENIVLRGPSKNNDPLFIPNFPRIEQLGQSSSLSTLREKLDLNKPAQDQEIQVQALVLATGFQPFNPERIGTYHYSSLENVVSSLDMEKIRKLRGSYLRPTDYSIPKRIAFIQCVGSRNENLGNLWCSRVCCPYALRMARHIQAEQPDTEITFFYMDTQNIDKDSATYLESCRSQFRLIRMMPVDISTGEDSAVKINYMLSEQEKMESEEFDLTILSIGIEPNPENTNLSEKFDIPLDKYGFFKPESEFNPALSRDKNIFLAGTATGPKDIPESIEQAGLAAKNLITYLGKQEK